jgi:endo-1,4-beta-mannosidase
MLTLVKLGGNYFQNEQGCFVPVGVNWIPARSAMQWALEWDPGAIEEDFHRMNRMNINLVRFDFLWQWVEPRPGQYNDKAFEQFDYLIRLAHKYDLYLNPALFAGGEVGDAWWDVPWRMGRHPHADSDMLYFQARHVEEFARRYAEEPAILAWDLTDEPPFWVVMKPGKTTDAMAAVWTQLLCDSIRRYDRNHLVMVGSSNMEVSRGPFRADVIEPWVDFFSVHPYPLYNQAFYPEPILSTRSSWSPAFETALSLGVGKPVLMQEFGSTSAQCTPEVQAKYYRLFMYSALGAGNMGLVAWTYTDADPQIQYKRAPYKRNPHETQFGTTEAGGTPRLQGEELAEMGALLKNLDFTTLKPAEIQAGILLPHEWANGLDFREYGFPSDTLYQYVPRDDLHHHATDALAQEQLIQGILPTFILARQADIPVGFPRENGGWQTLKLILVPYPLTGSSGVYFSYHLYTTFWQEAENYIREGGTLYASLNANSAIPLELSRRVCGVELMDRTVWEEEVVISFIEEFGTFKPGETMRYRPSPGVDGTGVRINCVKAKVLAVDQNGNPAITLHTLDQGNCIVSTYPLELFLGKEYGAFEKERPETRLYRSLADIAGLNLPVKTDNPWIELGFLEGETWDLLVCTNHSGQDQEACLRVNRPFVKVEELAASGVKAVLEATNGLKIGLKPYSGVIYRFFRK